jgi:hypothetical protein
MMKNEKTQKKRKQTCENNDTMMNSDKKKHDETH